MKTVLILGAGVMGTAFSVPLSDSGGRVLLVGTHLDDDWICSLKERRFHPKLNMRIPERVVPFLHRELDEAVSERPDLIVLGVSSPGIDWAVEQLAATLRDPAPVLLLTKGLWVNDGRIEVLPHRVASGLARMRSDRFASLATGGVGGPCIAGELAARRRTSVVFGADAGVHDTSRFLSASYYSVTRSDDVVGVETSAALKNFLAIGVGAAAGMLENADPAENEALMLNFESALFTAACFELKTLVTVLGGRAESAMGLAGVGDLYVTCRAGRNSRLGRLLGTGVTISEARKRMVDETIEGADLGLAVGRVLRNMMDRGDLDGERLSLTRSILSAVCDDEVFSFESDVGPL